MINTQLRCTFECTQTKCHIHTAVQLQNSIVKMNVPAEVAAGTKAEAADAKRARTARIRAIILVVIVVVDMITSEERWEFFAGVGEEADADGDVLRYYFFVVQLHEVKRSSSTMWVSGRDTDDRQQYLSFTFI